MEVNELKELIGKIDTLEPGLKINCLVAEYVMGWERANQIGGEQVHSSRVVYSTGEWYRALKGPGIDDPWSPSTSIFDAMEVFGVLPYPKEIKFSKNGDAPSVLVKCEHSYNANHPRYGYAGYADVDDLPLAICRSALKWKLYAILDEKQES